MPTTTGHCRAGVQIQVCLSHKSILSTPSTLPHVRLKSSRASSGRAAPVGISRLRGTWERGNLGIVSWNAETLLLAYVELARRPFSCS